MRARKFAVAVSQRKSGASDETPPAAAEGETMDVDIRKKPLIILAGPTAVGKTSTSVALAHALQGEIVSADSVQVYRGLDIGSAKVTKGEMEGVPHHLIDVIDVTED